MEEQTPVGRLVLVPAFLTLAVTLLRLAGELMNGTPALSPPPGLPDLDPLTRWLAIGVIPQFTLWVAVTVILGSLCGALSLALAPRRRGAAATES